MSDSGAPGHEVDEFELTGTVLAGRFRVDRPVGAGGFGVVYKGWHLGFDRPVAIKCLRIPAEMSAGERATFLRRFSDEGKLMFELSSLHAGIAKALELGSTTTAQGDVPFLVLEWLDGCSLEDLLSQGKAQGRSPPSPRRLIQFLDGAAHGLAAAHERGVAHRDIKPGNIFLTEVMGKRTSKVLDFGIAKVMQGKDSPAVALTTRLPGAGAYFTPLYGAPEQWLPNYGATGPWTDVFAFALVCVEVLTGAPALRGTDLQQYVGQVIAPGRRPTPRQLGLETSDAVEAVFQRALAVEPQDRYQAVAEFWAELCAAVAADGDARASLPSAPSVVSRPGGTVLVGPLEPSPTTTTSPVAHVPSIPSAPSGTGRRASEPSPAKYAAIPAVAVLASAVLFLFADPTSPMRRAAKGEPVPAAAPRASARPVASYRPGVGAVSVICQPACAQVAVDGRVIGPSPVAATPVSSGRRLVRAVMPIGSYELEVPVPPGEHVLLKFPP